MHTAKNQLPSGKFFVKLILTVYGKRGAKVIKYKNEAKDRRSYEKVFGIVGFINGKHSDGAGFDD